MENEAEGHTAGRRQQEWNLRTGTRAAGRNDNKKNIQHRKEERGGSSLATRKFIFLILLLVRKFGVANTASYNIPKREEKIEGDRGKKEIARHDWNEREDKERIHEQALWGHVQ